MPDPLLIPIIFVSSIPIIAIGHPIAKASAERIARRPSAGSIPIDVAQRLERMEHSIDSIAIEVERISEGQRFTTKLLAERVPAPDATALNRRE